MAKLIMMRGLPGSGKTTSATEMLKEYGNFVRVNKDDLRAMLHKGLDWNGKREKITKSVQYDMVVDLLTAGRSVIVDDTNLRDNDRQLWSAVAAEFNAKFEVIEMNTPFDICVQRDAWRDKPVGIHVIAGMAFRSEKYPNKKIILCDIDGTLADISHRLHHLDGDKKDWNSFFEECSEDTFREDIWEKVEKDALDNDADVIFVSGRSDAVREKTERWLYWHIGKKPIVLMRPHWDHQEDTSLKNKIYMDHFQNYDVIRVYDDRPSVIRMWRKHNLQVVDCGDGVEF